MDSKRLNNLRNEHLAFCTDCDTCRYGQILDCKMAFAYECGIKDTIEKYKLTDCNNNADNLEILNKSLVKDLIESNKELTKTLCTVVTK